LPPSSLALQLPAPRALPLPEFALPASSPFSGVLSPFSGALAERRQSSGFATVNSAASGSHLLKRERELLKKERERVGVRGVRGGDWEKMKVGGAELS
jgi:hypothetical protein